MEHLKRPLLKEIQYNANTNLRDSHPSPFQIPHRSNIKASAPEEYYRRVLAIPVLDTFIAKMEFHFNELNQRASSLLTLIPSIITKLDYYGKLW